jgi:hypothetical protein
MKLKITSNSITLLTVIMLPVLTGCYSQAYYPSYDNDYGSSNGGYPNSSYESSYDYGNQDYYGHDDDDDYGERCDKEGRPWQRNHYRGYYDR